MTPQAHSGHLAMLCFSVLVAGSFALGVLAVWTYAAIRPRFGAGPKTAVCAGFAVWVMSYFYAGVYVYAGIVIMPTKLTWCPVLWSLIEVPIATMAGATSRGLDCR